MKKPAILIIIFLIFVGITVALVFLPYQDFISRIPYFGDLANNTSVTIGAIDSKAKIKIDGKEYGETSQQITSLTEGTHNVELTRIVEDEDSSGVFYNPQIFSVELLSNTESIVNVEIGPEDAISGYILYYTDSPKTSESTGYITINSAAVECEATLDDDYLGKLPLNMTKIKKGNYNLKLSANGYESIEIPVIVRNGYNLNVKGYLFPVPINIKSESTNE